MNESANYPTDVVELERDDPRITTLLRDLGLSGVADLRVVETPAADRAGGWVRVARESGRGRHLLFVGPDYAGSIACQ